MTYYVMFNRLDMLQACLYSSVSRDLGCSVSHQTACYAQLLCYHSSQLAFQAALTTYNSSSIRSYLVKISYLALFCFSLKLHAAVHSNVTGSGFPGGSSQSQQQPPR